MKAPAEMKTVVSDMMHSELQRRTSVADAAQRVEEMTVDVQQVSTDQTLAAAVAQHFITSNRCRCRQTSYQQGK